MPTRRKRAKGPEPVSNPGVPSVGGGDKWVETIRAPAGGTAPRNILPAEREAVAVWIAQLEADLATRPTAADHAVLGSLGRVALLELRLSRKVFRSGLVKKTGEAKDALSEFRQIVKLKADLLGRLSFVSEPVKTPDLRAAWGDGGYHSDGDDGDTRPPRKNAEGEP